MITVTLYTINGEIRDYVTTFIVLRFCFLAGLGKELEDYVSTTWPDGVVRIVRLPERGGLIRARIAGAKAATGDVIIILDSHCEVNVQW